MSVMGVQALVQNFEAMSFGGNRIAFCRYEPMQANCTAFKRSSIVRLAQPDKDREAIERTYPNLSSTQDLGRSTADSMYERVKFTTAFREAVKKRQNFFGEIPDGIYPRYEAGFSARRVSDLSILYLISFEDEFGQGWVKIGLCFEKKDDETVEESIRQRVQRDCPELDYKIESVLIGRRHLLYEVEQRTLDNIDGFFDYRLRPPRISVPGSKRKVKESEVIFGDTELFFMYPNGVVGRGDRLSIPDLSKSILSTFIYLQDLRDPNAYLYARDRGNDLVFDEVDFTNYDPRQVLNWAELRQIARRRTVAISETMIESGPAYRID